VTEAYAYDAVRTPLGRLGGALAQSRPGGHRRGVAAICIGVGHGLAVVLENAG
jgi:acetyl-CoA acetyltransferase